MKICKSCRIQAVSKGDFCPLCGDPVHTSEYTGPPLPRNTYPDLRSTTAQSNVMLRILLFISLLGCGVSVLVNLLVPTGFLWCAVVVAAVAYCWMSIPPLLRRGVNYAARTVLLSVLTALLLVLFDFLTGWSGWSVSYAIPAILDAGIVAVGLIIVFNRTDWSRYVLAQVTMGGFGFIPLLLYFLGLATSIAMVIFTAALALASLLITLIFGDRTIKSEFKRRFHI